MVSLAVSATPVARRKQVPVPTHSVKSGPFSAGGLSYDDHVTAARTAVVVLLGSEFLSKFPVPTVFTIELRFEDVGSGQQVVIGTASTESPSPELPATWQ